MPELHVSKHLTNQQMISVARKVLTDRYGTSANLHFAITCEVDPTVIVWHNGKFGLSPNPCIGKIGEYIPDAVICPWCEKDLIGKSHELQCNRPNYVYSHEECGQPDYQKGWQS
jgi:hypothetical protein